MYDPLKKCDGVNDGCCLLCPELDALGDELLMDDDSSYLDEASTAPSIPEGLPGEKSTSRVLHSFRSFLISLQSFLY